MLIGYTGPVTRVQLELWSISPFFSRWQPLRIPCNHPANTPAGPCKHPGHTLDRPGVFNAVQCRSRSFWRPFINFVRTTDHPLDRLE